MTQSYLDRLFGLSGKTAVVIGGTGVLGGAMAVGLARAGATVILAGRNPERGAERVAEIEKLGGKACCFPVEVAVRASMEELLKSCLSVAPKIDVLINGAGTNAASPYFEVDDESWSRVIESNLTGVHLGCQIFGKHMAETGGGSIINIGSVTAHLPLSRVFAYSASKAAVINLTQNVARELATQKVRVNALCPGFFPAEQNRAILDQTRRDNIFRNTPVNRYGEPEELVGTVLLLASENAGGYITGATYYVDGGFTAMRF
ncbi:MAG TPA: SDR family oxidoreductase [Pirellulales bacterium]